MAGKVIEELQKARKNMKTLNVMLFGITGVGKSTLINNVFNENLAATGVGRPVSDSVRKYTKPDFPLAVYDTPGLELKGSNAVDKLLNEAVEIVKKGMNSGDINDAVHCVWYCISSESSRIQQSEMDFIRGFAEKTCGSVPVIIVLTKSYIKNNAAALKSAIERENLPVAQVVPVLAMDTQIDENYIAKAYGLDTLVEIMDTVVDESVKNTLAAVQKASLPVKVKKAQAIVAASSAAAAATGAIPIPFADATVLVPEEIAMLTGITVVFGLPVEKATIASIISSTIGTMGATAIGRSLFYSLLKLIPGVGSVVGGAISASVAAAVTASLGETYIAVLTKITKGEMKLSDIGTKSGKSRIRELFRSRLSVRRNKDGSPENKF